MYLQKVKTIIQSMPLEALINEYNNALETYTLSSNYIDINNEDFFKTYCGTVPQKLPLDKLGRYNKNDDLVYINMDGDNKIYTFNLIDKNCPMRFDILVR